MTKRALLISLILVLFFAVLPLPWLIYVPVARNAALSWLGHNLSATLSAESCSFGWFTGLECKDFRYLSQDQSIELQSSEVRGSKGLLTLLLAPLYVGDISLKEPLLTIHAGQEKTATGPRKSNQARLVSWWNRGGFQLKAYRGQVQLQHGEEHFPLLGDITFSGLLANGSLRYTLEGNTSPDADGNLQAEGFVNAPPESRTGAALLSNTTVILKPGKIAALPTLPWTAALLAGVDGTASGTCRLVRNVDGSVQAQGALTVQDVLLPAFTATDQRLPLEKASLLFDLTRQERQQWQIDQLQLDSPLAAINAHGLLHAQKSELRAALSLDLPPLTEALRSTLMLYPDAQFSKGGLQCNLLASGPGAELPLQLDCAVSDLEARRGEATFVWKKPMAFSAHAMLANKVLSVQEAKLQAALLNLDANRSAAGEAFAIEASANLQALDQELSKVLQLPLQTQGKLSLAAARKQGNPAGWQDELDFTITDCALRNPSGELLPPHTLSMQARGTESPSGARSGKLRATWWPGSFELNLNGLQGLGTARKGSYTVAGSMLLARLQPLVKHFLPQLSAVNMAGSMGPDLEAQVQGSIHLITNLQAMLNRPVIKVAARDAVYSFQAARSILAAGKAAQNTPAPGRTGPNRINSLQLANTPASLHEQHQELSFFDLQQQSLQLQPLALSSDGVQLRGGLSISQWGHERPSYAFHAHGNMDGAILDTLLRASSRMPAGLKLQGPAQIALQANYPGNPLPEAAISAQLGSVEYGQDERLLFREEAINLFLRLEAAESSQLGSWDIPEFSVHNSVFWAKGKGFLWDGGKGSGMLALQGRYERLGLKQRTAQDQTDEANRFQLSVPLQ